MFLFIKRLFDLFLSTFLVCLFLPIFLIIFVCLFVFNGGDIFYLQERIGYRNQKFKMIKFSSMLRISEQLPGGIITLRNDPRVTSIGRILRLLLMVMLLLVPMDNSTQFLPCMKLGLETSVLFLLLMIILLASPMNTRSGCVMVV